ncbi:hypothetical protein [Superficieibacter sp.]|uniref:hypothetical protein n=1 Tax=Superficieibacter sp. TaxID=2303322 RepID=UPI0028A6FD17|nr:hypothetical protein [Superficieibacter sp.]
MQRFGDAFTPGESLYSPLYNNIRGTNFPKWDDEDIHAEYRLHFNTDKDVQ